MKRWLKIGVSRVLLCGALFVMTRSLSAQDSTSAAQAEQQSAPQNDKQSSAPANPAPPPASNPSPATAQTPPQSQPQTPGTQTTPEHKAKPGHPKSASQKKKKNTSGSKSAKIVVRNGGVKDSSAQLSPGMTKEQALHDRKNTAELLATTDANLNAVTGRQLSSAQQSMLDQVRAYVRQSKAASASGDLPRAHTLAYKARLLSDELARK